MTLRPARIAASCIGLAILGLTGCLLTSSFDDVAGVRPDAALDAPSIDAGTSDAAEADAEVVDAPADVPTKPWCASQMPPHLICADFDQGMLVGSGFSPNTTKGGLATLDTVHFTSPPAAFQAHVPAQVEAAAGSAIIIAKPMITPSAIHYAFDMRIDDCKSAGPNGSVTLAGFAPSKTMTYGLILTQSGMAFAEQSSADGGSGFVAHPVMNAPAVGVWTRVKIDLTLTPASAMATVTFDAKVGLSTKVDGVVPDGSVFLLNLGANALGPTGVCDVAYDNVTFDADK